MKSYYHDFEIQRDAHSPNGSCKHTEQSEELKQRCIEKPATRRRKEVKG